MNKKTLSVFPYPWVLSWIQIAVGAVFMLIMWKLRIFKPPEGGFTKEMFKALIPTSLLHLLAHVSACASYKLGSVSFMQVVKAGEPACSVILLSLFFGRKYSKLVWLTLLPIVGGVAVGSTTELNFSMAAFLCAMTSNIASALRGVTSKDLQTETGLAGINLYGGIAIVSGIMQLPLSLIMEGSQMSAAFAHLRRRSWRRRASRSSVSRRVSSPTSSRAPCSTTCTTRPRTRPSASSRPSRTPWRTP